jgi:hypothetical protein
MATTPFEIDLGRVRIGDAVLLYLERAYAPRDPLPAGDVPRSHGVAPMFVSAAGAVVAPVAAGEAIWLGFQAVDRDRPVTVRVRLEGAEPLDAVTGAPWREGISDEPRRNHLVCPPDSRLVGVPRAEGRRPFGTTSGEPRAGVVEELTVIAWVPKPVAIAVQLVRPERFTRLSGVVPEPIDPGDAYDGRRLP